MRMHKVQEKYKNPTYGQDYLPVSRQELKWGKKQHRTGPPARVPPHIINSFPVSPGAVPAAAADHRHR
jgi:hypothetical protein